MANPFREELKSRQDGSKGATSNTANPFAQELRSRQDSSPATFTNQGIARSLGFPVDVANELLGLVGLDSDMPIGGRESIERAMTFLGEQTDTQMLPKEGEEPNTYGESIARGVGDAAGGLISFGGPLASVGKRATGTIGQAAQGITRQTARRPARTTAAEVTAGATSGAGGQLAAESFPESDEARALGEIAGGLGLPAAGGAVKNLPSVLMLRQAGRLARPLVEPFTPSGGERRAQDRTRDLAEDPERAASRQTDETIADLTPAQRTGERRFMELEATRRQEDPEFDARIREQQSQAMDQLRRAGRGIGGRARVSETREAIRKEVQAAQDQIDKRLAELTPARREEEASRVVREELGEALKRARQQESRFYSRVPKEAEAPTESTRATFEDVLTSRDDVDDPEDVPPFLKKLVGRLNDNGAFSTGKIGEQASIDRLQRLRSRILATRDAERAKDAPNRRKLSILEQMQEAVLEDMGAAADNVQGEAGQALRQALDFSRELNQRFTQGAVGRVLGFSADRGVQTPPEATLEGIVGRTGGQGVANARQLAEATRDAPEATQKAVQDFVRNRFLQQAVKDGEIDPRRAEEFIERNRELLDQFGDLSQEIQQAAEGRRSVNDFRRSDVGRFLDAREGEEITQILRSKNPGKAAREVMRSARRTGGEEATQGVKSALIDNIFDRAQRSEFDETGQRMLSGKALRAAVQDKQLRPVVDAVLSDTERNKLGRIARELQIVEEAQRARTRPEGMIDDRANQVLSTLARVIGARAGAAAGGNSMAGGLQGAQILSGRAREFITRLTNDRAQELLRRAVEPGNEQLFRTLLTDVRRATPRQQRIINQRLNAYLAGPGSDLLPDNDESTRIEVNRFKREQGGPRANQPTQQQPQ